MRVTIKDIANYCGVSEGTVDRALHNRPGIGAETKAKILQAVKELNYKPDLMARGLAKGKTMTIGVVLFDLYNRSFAQIMEAVEVKSREYGYFVHLVLTDKDRLKEKKYIEHLVSRKVDGMILMTVNHEKSFDSYLKNLNIPIVTIYNRVSDDWPYVGIDDRRAMKDAVRYIGGKGYEKIVYICPPLRHRGNRNIYTQEERLNGCLEGIQEFGIKDGPVIIQDKHYVESLKKIDLRQTKTAILCACDIYALEVMNFLKSEGYRIPQDVGVMGFDNIDVLKYVSPALTTVEYCVEEIGSRATECLVNRLEGRAYPQVMLLDYKIVEGESI